MFWYCLFCYKLVQLSFYFGWEGEGNHLTGEKTQLKKGNKTKTERFVQRPKEFRNRKREGNSFAIPALKFSVNFCYRQDANYQNL